MDLKSSGRARRSSWRGGTYKLYVITPTHIPLSLKYIYIYISYMKNNFKTFTFYALIRIYLFIYWKKCDSSVIVCLYI